jgi:cbb3-type cytochrome oxidase subunit 3
MNPEILVTVFIMSPLLLVLAYLFRIRKRVRRDGSRYMFFKVRDDLIMLVAQGHLREDEFLFKEFYNAVNRFVNSTEHFTLKNIIRGLSRLDEEKKLGSEGSFAKRVEEELKGKHPCVKHVVSEFYDTIFKVLYRNSLVLRFVLKCVFPPMFTFYMINKFARKINDHFNGKLSQGIRLAWKSKNTAKLIRKAA